ncbi:spermidine/putrescine transport system substrate-binding protein [Tistlia consotensis]|uniref:Spermidine/putrescine transport system substrate-binding protein n=1 Tax=Tistlia consotensis USBA 355 TaxID=560819 RepID=A0A1Y6CE70_9PROT|nr:extracellular solute-binding protein [Tistlia consotensis]SMF51562.1 spermidine/putrescine transport system substrate-binding protein [Tistlia consotensis USBA 355]SNR84021.1 spermidine/putrescine transport system substrate-binding protein [Tistlia consotensis]
MSSKVRSESPTGLRPALAAAALAVLALRPGPAAATEELNALVWCDHTDPALIEPFEKAHDVKVNLKEYEGTGTALALVDQSQPGDWDVFVVDGVDVPRVVEAGLLAPLPDDQLPLDDVFPQVRMDDVTVHDGKRYAVMEKFGYNVVGYNKAKVDPADMRDLTTLWGDRYKGRIAVYDYYIPLMDLVALELGMKPDEISEKTLPKIREALFKLKDNAAMVGEVVSSTTALATGEADILLGGGEWAVAVMEADNPDLTWVLPKQGGILWAQSIGVFQSSKKQQLALAFVKYIMSPEGQARLATSSCFWGMPANRKAGAVLSDAQKATLRWDEQPDFLARSYRYFIPDAALDAKMLDVWTEFLQH